MHNFYVFAAEVIRNGVSTEVILQIYTDMPSRRYLPQRNLYSGKLAVKYFKKFSSVLKEEKRDFGFTRSSLQ